MDLVASTPRDIPTPAADKLDWIGVTPRELAPPADPSVFVLPNRATIAIVERPDLPIVAMSIAVLPDSEASAGVRFAFAHLIAQLRRWQFELIDCQQQTGHLSSLGGAPISRDAFLECLRRLLHSSSSAPPSGGWRFDDDVVDDLVNPERHE